MNPNAARMALLSATLSFTVLRAVEPAPAPAPVPVAPSRTGQATDLLEGAASLLGKNETGSATSALSVETIVAGLKTGLGTGVDRA
jgi:hypothetical protein